MGCSSKWKPVSVNATESRTVSIHGSFLFVMTMYLSESSWFNPHVTLAFYSFFSPDLFVWFVFLISSSPFLVWSVRRQWGSPRGMGFVPLLLLLLLLLLLQHNTLLTPPNRRWSVSCHCQTWTRVVIHASCVDLVLPCSALPFFSVETLSNWLEILCLHLSRSWDLKNINSPSNLVCFLQMIICYYSENLENVSMGYQDSQ